MTSTEQIGLNKTWELSLYELHRTPQDAIVDNTEIAVSPRSLHSELMCPICLDMLKKTMTTKECLHRFFVTNTEAHQERVLAKLNKSHSQAALVNSITEGIKLQSQNRPNRSRKNNEEQREQIGEPRPAAENTENPVTPIVPPATTVPSISTPRLPSPAPQSGRSTPSQPPSPVSSNVSSISKSLGKRPKSNMTSERSEESESSERTEQTDTEGEGPSEPITLNEIELVFKPHPTEMAGDNHLVKALKENSIRYIKTTANATVDHLHKYLAMRLTIDLDSQLSQTHNLLNFCIYISPSTGQYVQLNGNQTLGQVNDRYWKVNKPLEMYYSWKKT
ncbi:hypothetical protein RI129_009923 [Pyrocoelia pectoralis]|uniref:RING-type E3 ubiquitin transferase n=1 Tax=Pyrocoelia pectoralis TaxID=417401 RepID=A0AAN7ZIX1_9COLE